MSVRHIIQFLSLWITIMLGETGLLDEKLLRLFEALYATRSVSRAAAQLGQAQPTVSIWLRRLREMLRDPLFIRTDSGMLPTPRADELIGTVRGALALLQQLAAPPAAYIAATDTRCFRICMTDASHATLLPQLLGYMRKAAPLARVQIFGIDEHTGTLLQSGAADLALGLIPALDAGFFQQALYTQDWVCLARQDHPHLQTGLDRKAYETAGHVGIISGTGHVLLEAALKKHGVERRLVLELPGFLGLAAIISSTDLLATLPRHIGETLARNAGLTVHPCPIPVSGFTVKQHWHARYNLDPANRWLRRSCAKLFMRISEAEEEAAKYPEDE